MNWQHVTAFLWLRWRLWVNQWRRAGALIVVLMSFIAVLVATMAVPSFIGCVIAGSYLIPRADPVHLMYAWDGVLLAFAFFWMIGLITELQRTEPLSLSKFLHLPVSVNGAFLINYISSLLRLSLIMFVPTMLGFCVALVRVKGPLFLLTLPSLAAFLLMVTALTYQFQGWLASLMNNPRRRRTVVVVTTMIFVLIVQLPNLLNISTGFWGVKERGAQSAKFADEREKLRLESENRIAKETSENAEEREKFRLALEDRIAKQSAKLAEEREKLQLEHKNRPAGESTAYKEELDKLLADHKSWLTKQSAQFKTDLEKLETNYRDRMQRQAAMYTEELEKLHLEQEHSMKSANREGLQQLERTARLINLVVPLGWLPLGVSALAEGHVLPAILGCLGMTLIGSASLWRAYRTTMGLYQGEFTTQKSSAAPAAIASNSARPSGIAMLERRLPVVSEQVSVIALGCLRSLMRSAEAKMMLLTLVVMSLIFGSMLFNAPPHLPESARPLVAMGGMMFVLFGMLQLMSNQFGFDRDGFRVFVLCAAPRRDILLGKNLAFAPMALGMAALLLIAAQVLCPMRLGHFLAMFPQLVSMYLLFCVSTNLLSIYAPLYIAAGSLKPANPKLGTILLQLAMFMILFPLTQAPTLLPLGIEALLVYRYPDAGWIAAAPICLVGTLVECAAVVAVYRFSLNWQGGLLQEREQKILERVTNRG